MLVEMDLGLISQLTDSRLHWLHSLRAGLFQGSFEPWRGAVISDLTPCDFSGYSGLRDMVTWGMPAMVGPRAITQHGFFLWRHDGGLVANVVQGYYVVDGGGVLVWAELRAEGGQLLQSLGDVYRAVPRYSLRSEF
jgi:hypothetical protein